MEHSAHFKAFLDEHAPATLRQTDTATYTGSSHHILGIPADILKAAVKRWLQTHRHSLDVATVATLYDDLLATDIYETRAIAGYIMRGYAPIRRAMPLNRLEGWLRQCEGWAEVDGFAYGSITYQEMAPRWEAWQAFLRAAATAAHISLRRAALVMLVLPVRKAPTRDFLDLALENVSCLQHEPHKLVTKAISWVLREGTKQHPRVVADYLTANAAQLPAIAVRETRHKLKKDGFEP